MLEVTRRSRWLRYVNTVIGAKENAIQGLLSPIHIARGFGLTASLCQSVFNSCLKMGDCNPRVLSIQSHVVSGYVGNKSATFPLQVLGFDVDAINSVQFSNHTGYGYWKGQVLAEEELVDLTEGLAHNGLDCCYTHLLTGYNRSKSFLTHIANTVCELRKKNPGLIYLCDPVMGDIGRGVYVPTELIEVYRDVIVPIANIITPNQFELELLTGKPVKSLDDAWDALGILHSMGPKVAVISSSELSDEDSLLCLGSMIVEGKRERAMVTFPKLEGSYTGTGDLFSALFLAWMWRTNQNMKQSLEFTIATIYAVLKRTESSKQCSGDNDKASVSGHELKLIQSKSDIENPNVIYHALPVLP